MRIADHLWDYVQGGDVAECWEWTRCRSKKGYGQVNVIIDGRPTLRRAHRLAYEQLIGPIPDGLEPDHLCLNTGCVNPWHLELVTKRINVRRGNAARVANRPNSCKWGHAWTPGNTIWRRSRLGTPTKVCRECNSLPNRRARKARRA